MKSLSSIDRRHLRRLQICLVNEPWLGNTLPQLPHQGQRVLVPAHLRSHLSSITAQGGAIKDMPARDLRKIVVTLARKKVGAHYCATALPSLAPKVYSCSTLTYWVFAFIGIHFPRFAVDQSFEGRPIKKPIHGGLAFYENSFPIRDPDRAIGHVVVTTHRGTSIHGSMAQKRIVEEPILDGAVLFIDPFPRRPQILILIPPKIQGVQTALDLARWLERPPRF